MKCMVYAPENDSAGTDRWISADEYQVRSTPALGYSPAERESWLLDCAIITGERDYDYDDYHGRDGNSGLIGGLLGAVIGGFAGNRIDDSGSRLGGTLIGAGIGGIAGAVIGSVIDGERKADSDSNAWDDIDPYALRYCDAYLRRYEAQGVGAFGGSRAQCTSEQRR